MKLKLLQVRESTGERVMRSADVARLMRQEAKADRECFWVLHLDGRNQVIEKELVTMGSVNCAFVHPREIFKKAILNGAVAIITAHNHPSGLKDPSDEDLRLWSRLDTAGEVLGIRVLDHLIITPAQEHFSRLDVWPTTNRKEEES